MRMKKPVSSGDATHRMPHTSRVALSLPLSVKRSPTWIVLGGEGSAKRWEGVPWYVDRA